jgi:hypothetical protein
MLALDNRTRFPAALVPSLSKDGEDRLTVVVRGTFELSPREGALRVAETQTPIVWTDLHHGEPGVSSVRWESDTAPVKRGTDVMLIGQAWAPPGGVKTLDVALRVGPVRKVVRVFGDRRWVRGLTGWSLSNPEPFRTMPLVYERAYGGADATDAQRPAFEARNPIGTGFVAHGAAERLKDLRAPNCEDPRALVTSWQDRPAPAGFGVVARGWSPRLALAGTYDEGWSRDRAPLLPDDFDERYFNGAPVDQVVAAGLRGDEPVEIVNASKDGRLAFALPGRRVSVGFVRRYEFHEHETRLDTVVLEPDERRVVLVWRTLIPCPRALLTLDEVVVREAA